MAQATVSSCYTGGQNISVEIEGALVYAEGVNAALESGGLFVAAADGSTLEVDPASGAESVFTYTVADEAGQQQGFMDSWLGALFFGNIRTQ